MQKLQRKKIYIGAILIALIFIFIFIFVFINYNPKNNNYNGKTFNTYYQITIPKKYDKIDKKEITKIFNKVNELASTFNQNSEISKINSANLNEWIEISPQQTYLLRTSFDIYKQSSGYFDITIGNLINLWGFGTIKEQKLPQNKEVLTAINNSGFDKLIFNKTFNQIQKTNDIKLNLSAIAKGYAIDEISKYLIYLGIDDFLINVGGQIYANGNSDKNTIGWNVALQNPIKKHKKLRVINLNNEGIATSGDYQNFYINDNKYYSHIINPKTGYTVERELVSVSIINKSNILCDAYATTILAMGIKQGLKFANKNNLKAILYTLHDDVLIENLSLPLLSFD